MRRLLNSMNLSLVLLGGTALLLTLLGSMLLDLIRRGALSRLFTNHYRRCVDPCDASALQSGQTAHVQEPITAAADLPTELMSTLERAEHPDSKNPQERRLELQKAVDQILDGVQGRLRELSTPINERLSAIDQAQRDTHACLRQLDERVDGLLADVKKWAKQTVEQGQAEVDRTDKRIAEQVAFFSRQIRFETAKAEQWLDRGVPTRRVRFSCRGCCVPLHAPYKHRGKTARCRRCGRRNLVPHSSTRQTGEKTPVPSKVAA